MDLRNLNLDDARKTESFGAAALKSGAYTITILGCEKGMSKSNTTYLNFKIQIGDVVRYTTLWLTKSVKNTGAIIENEYDSRRLKQLLILLRVEPNTLTEIPSDKDWLVNIPQIKGSVGAVIEVTPAHTKYNDSEYSKVDIVSFYIIKTMQTVPEFTNNKTAEIVQKEVDKLQNKEYVFLENTPSNNTPTQTGYNPPKPFTVEPDDSFTEDDLPY